MLITEINWKYIVRSVGSYCMDISWCMVKKIYKKRNSSTKYSVGLIKQNDNQNKLKVILVHEMKVCGRVEV
jgi:hypothetical protein